LLTSIFFYSAVNEVEAGAVQSFTIFDNGTLSGAIATTSSGGNGPAHVFASPDGEVSAMNVSHLRLGAMDHG
jgi:hypothetical protein